MGYRISELADRSGFSASTLRYYESIGLFPPPERTSSGYRVYDDAALERVTFIQRAKSLGLSLDEIAELVELWDNGPCAPVQQRLRHLLVAKLADVRGQRAELQRFASQLEHLSASLATTEPADRCGPGCGCDTQLSSAREPIACTLSAGEAADRSRAWASLLTEVVDRQPTDGGVRLRLPADASLVAQAAELAVGEADCCAFFSFVVSINNGGAWLEVTAPPDGGVVLHALFGLST